MRYHIVTNQMMRVVRKTQTKALFYYKNQNYLDICIFFCTFAGQIRIFWIERCKNDR